MLTFECMCPWFALLLVIPTFAIVNAEENATDSVVRELQDVQLNHSSAEEHIDQNLFLYRKLFNMRRHDQLEAVARILDLKDYEKRFQMVNMVLEQISKTLTTSKITLGESGYIPGDLFPTDNKIKDALSIVLENTALFGEVLLKIPDITHKIYKRDKVLKETITWAIFYCNQTQIYEGVHHKLLDLVAQELGIIEKNPDYHNPYRDSKQSKFQIEKENDRKKYASKKKKEKVYKGPRLTKPKVEL